MLGPTLVDHLRLTFGHVIYTHRAHTELAVRCAKRNRILHAVEGMGLLVTVIGSVALLTTGEAAYSVVTTIAASVAVLAFSTRVFSIWTPRQMLIERVAPSCGTSESSIVLCSPICRTAISHSTMRASGVTR